LGTDGTTQAAPATQMAQTTIKMKVCAADRVTLHRHRHIE
jgi:hypothetical protein